MPNPHTSRGTILVLALLILASPRLRANPGQPDTGLPVGAPVVLGHTHATVAKGQDGKIYFAGNTGSAWQVSRLKSPYPLANETNNVTFALDPGYHRASFSDSTGTEIRGVRAMAPWYDDSVIVGGDFTKVDGADRPYLARLNPDGTPDPTFPPRFNGVVHAVVRQTDGKILVGGDFTRVTYTTGGGGELTTTTHHDCPGFTRLNPDGTLDSAFHLATRFGAGHPSGVCINAIAVDRLGQILVGGRFVTVHWGGEFQTRDSYARLRPDGSFDSTFPNVDLDPRPGSTRPDIRVLTIQPDGKIVLAGLFRLDSTKNIIRLLADGTVDSGFSPSSNYSYDAFGEALMIEAVHARADGRLLVGLSGQPTWTYPAVVLAEPGGVGETELSGDVAEGNRATGFVELADGSVLVAGRVRVNGFSEDRWLTRVHRDLSCSPGNGFPVLPATYRPYAMVQRPDGRWVVGGARPHASHPGLATGYLANGRPDPKFPIVDGLTGPVHALALLPDDSTILAGNFTLANDTLSHRGIVRFMPGFSSSPRYILGSYGTGVDGWVHSVAALPDGKLLIAGRFTATGTGGATRQHLARLDAAGSLDLTFNANLGFTDPNPLVWDVDVDAEGRIVISGNFGTVGGTAKPGFARLIENGGIDPTFTTTIGGGNVFATTLLGDGRMLIAGSFTSASGFTQAGGPTLLRGVDGYAEGGGGFLSSITWPSARGPDTHLLGVEAMAAQTDGQVVVSRRFRQGGYQSGVNNDYWNEVSLLPTTDSPIAKLLNHLDSPIGDPAGFPFDYLNHASTLIEADGRLLVGGEFTKTTDGVFRGPVARLRNDPAESYLSVRGGNSIAWSRQGAAPEAQAATFDISTNGGVTWSPAGTATRYFSTWEWNGTLPDRGIVRARAIIPTGGTAHGAGSSSGLVEAHTYFRYPLVLRFRSWMADYLPNLGSIPSYILFSLDSDGDSMLDWMEFALGTHPLSGLSGPLPLQFSGTFQSGSFTSHGTPTMHVVGTGPSADRRMLYSRRKDHVEAGLVYRPQFSTDLHFWFESADPGEVIADDATHELLAVRLPASAAGSDKLFFRVGLLGEMDMSQP
jgi:uncharacterized delta-60 repeat protein